jgi:hypothetical protein
MINPGVRQFSDPSRLDAGKHELAHFISSVRILFVSSRQLIWQLAPISVWMRTTQIPKVF